MVSKIRLEKKHQLVGKMKHQPAFPAPTCSHSWCSSGGAAPKKARKAAWSGKIGDFFGCSLVNGLVKGTVRGNHAVLPHQIEGAWPTEKVWTYLNRFWVSSKGIYGKKCGWSQKDLVFLQKHVPKVQFREGSDRNSLRWQAGSSIWSMISLIKWPCTRSQKGHLELGTLCPLLWGDIEVIGKLSGVPNVDPNLSIWYLPNLVTPCSIEIKLHFREIHNLLYPSKMQMTFADLFRTIIELYIIICIYIFLCASHEPLMPQRSLFLRRSLYIYIYI